MHQEELKEVLKLHRLWLDGKDGGERANLSRAYLRLAYLSRANLSRADLRLADLRLADLSGANLSGSDLSWAVGDGKRIRTLIGMKYHINIWDDMMAIGCQQHKIEEWFEFDDETIAAMDSGALEWWSANKQFLKDFIERLKNEQ